MRVKLGLAAQTPYDGRHSFASLLLHEGQHLAYVVQWFFFALLALALPVVLAVLDRRADTAGRGTGETPADRTAPAGVT